MHHAVHVSRSFPHTNLGKQDTLSLNLLSKSISDHIRGSDGSIYAEESAYVNAHSFILCSCMALVLRLVGVVRNSSSRTSMVVHSCEFCLALADPLAHVPSYVSTLCHWRGADAPSLLAEFYGSHSKSSLLHQPLKATERWCCTPRCISLRN